MTLLAGQRSLATTTGATPTKPKVTRYSKLGMDGFTDVGFNTAADHFLDTVEGIVDSLEHSLVEEISSNGGVLTIETAGKGTFIVNKQAPAVQLWLSSPISGPHHYDMVTVRRGAAEVEEVTEWHCDKNGHSLQAKLEEELSEIIGTPVKL